MDKISAQIKVNTLKTNSITFDLLESGDVFKIYSMHHQINLLRGNLLDGSVANLYLRVLDDQIRYQPLLGVKSHAAFKLINDQAVYQGEAFGLKYQVVLTLKEKAWYYSVLVLENSSNIRYDIVYGQDIAIASMGSILSSEAYTAQYIDHKIFQDDDGYTICSRQNNGDPQHLQIGSLTPNIAYATEGFQVFTQAYKLDQVLHGLKEEKLPSTNYQYEFPYITLQSQSYQSTTAHHVIFYGYYEPNYDVFIETPFTIEHPKELTFDWIKMDDGFKTSNSFQSEVLVGKNLSEAQMNELYPNRNLVEYYQDRVVSFFLQDHTHVVLKEKELLVERPHGHILIHGDIENDGSHVMATTNFMYGIFNSHVVLGNTNFHRLNSVSRSALNVQKISGQRIYIKLDQTYQLLGVPSAYELGINYAKWIYVFDQDTIVVTSYVGMNDHQQVLKVSSLKHNHYDFLITNQLTLGHNEYEKDVPVEIKERSVVIKTINNQMIQNAYPKLTYTYFSKQPVTISDDSLLFKESKHQGLLVMAYEKQSDIELTLTASYDGVLQPKEMSFTKEHEKMTNYIHQLTGISFRKEDHRELERLSAIVFWYTHNALVHYASPHGLEQYNGAAWGTRDVCQGPIELFSSAQRYDIVRKIILKTFARQFVENGDFPQWFMFDRYYFIQAHESHGDVIVWPIKALSDYLSATKDQSILKEKVPFMSIKENKFIEEDKTLLDHVKKTLDAIEASYIEGTHLPRYGGGDWDDTLQPANKKLTAHMVSGWTTLLLFQALKQLAYEIEEDSLQIRLNTMADQIEKDYRNFLIKDGIPAGFIVFENDHIEYLLHPTDNKTGLKYRLLPLTRGMISEFYTLEEVERYNQIINTHLKHPDGVRLMNTAVTYRGGKKTYFQRAETAANFGREIGIQYVHAHIRYIEAMSKIGLREEAYQALYTINPILIQDTVKNARIRQSNAYFSSSDAAFNDRYQAKKEFERVRAGLIEVKGGWRIYSSGPGIYINQLIRHIFGIRILHQHLVLDPMIPNELDGLEINYHYQNKPIKIQYYFGDEQKVTINDQPVLFEKVTYKYRNQALMIKKSTLDSFETIHIKVTIKK